MVDVSMKYINGWQIIDYCVVFTEGGQMDEESEAAMGTKPNSEQECT